MGLAGPSRPRVSRETRLLLVTILVSLAALWALARIRFPERPVTTNPVPPLLTQLTNPHGFEDLATQISQVEARVLPSLERVGSSVALRVRDHAGAVFAAAQDGSLWPSELGTVVAGDHATGLTLVSIAPSPAPALTAWDPGPLARSRYLIAADTAPGGVALRPVYVGRLDPVSSGAWRAEIWALPARTTVAAGEFLFALDGTLAGLVVPHASSSALVPGSVVLNAAAALSQNKRAGGGWLGVDVQRVPPSIGAGSEGPPGVIVTWVHPEGPAAEKLFPLDVIESVGGTPIGSPAEWRTRVAELGAGATMELRVRRGAKTRDVSLTAAGGPPRSESVGLGLTLRSIRRTGAEVTAVATGSAGARAGIREGDVITAIGDLHAPTAQQVVNAFEEAPAGTVLAAVTRGSSHRIVELARK